MSWDCSYAGGIWEQQWNKQEGGENEGKEFSGLAPHEAAERIFLFTNNSLQYTGTGLRCLRMHSCQTAGVLQSKLGFHKWSRTQMFAKERSDMKGGSCGVCSRFKQINAERILARPQESAGLHARTIRSWCLHRRAGISTLLFVTSLRVEFCFHSIINTSWWSPLIHLSINCWRSPPGNKSDTLGNQLLQVMLNHFFALKLND